MNNPDVVKEYQLGFHSDSWLVKAVGGNMCTAVSVIKRKDGSFALRRTKLHPEMVPWSEWIESVDDPAYKRKSAQYRKLSKVLPDRESEIPIHRKVAFCLVLTARLGPAVAADFSPEIEAMCESLIEELGK